MSYYSQKVLFYVSAAFLVSLSFGFQTIITVLIYFHLWFLKEIAHSSRERTAAVLCSNGHDMPFTYRFVKPTTGILSKHEMQLLHEYLVTV